MWSGEARRTARVSSFSFHTVVLPLPPSFSPLPPPLWSSRRRHCCLGVICSLYLFSMCDHTAFLTSYPVTHTQTHVHTNAHVNTHLQRDDIGIKIQTDTPEKESLTTKPQLCLRGCKNKSWGRTMLPTWRAESLRSLTCYHYLTSPSFLFAALFIIILQRNCFCLCCFEASLSSFVFMGKTKRRKKPINLMGIKVRQRLCPRKHHMLKMSRGWRCAEYRWVADLKFMFSVSLSLHVFLNNATGCMQNRELWCSIENGKSFSRSI